MLHKINYLILACALLLAAALSAQEEENGAAKVVESVLTDGDEEFIYEATDIDDATNYVISAALSCEPKILVSLSKKTTMSDAKKLAMTLADYRLASSFMYNVHKKGKMNVVELDPTYTSCIRMIRYINSPQSVTLTPKEEAALDKAREVIRTLALDGRTNTEKAVAIHDWLVENCEYDVPGYRRGFFSFKNSEAYNPYDGKYMILEQKGVCDSYAQAYWLMLQMVNVPSCMISGNSKRGGKHSWNLVYLDDHWGHVDTTWDDPIPDQPGRVLHNYFDLNAKEMAKTHRWKKNIFSTEQITLKYDKVEDFIAYLKRIKKKDPSYTVIIKEAKDSEKFMELATEACAQAALREKLIASPDVFFPGALRIRILKGKRK